MKNYKRISEVVLKAENILSRIYCLMKTFEELGVSSDGCDPRGMTQKQGKRLSEPIINVGYALDHVDFRLIQLERELEHCKSKIPAHRCRQTRGRINETST